MINFVKEGLDARAISEHIIQGDVSSVELTEQVLDNIQRANPSVNAVCSLDETLARKIAVQNDALLARIGTKNRAALSAAQPFFGIPSLLKDLGTADPALPSSMGSAFFGTVRFSEEGDLVKRYKRAGLGFIGRTTSAELGLSPTTEGKNYGAPTRNPWNLAHSAGGSSGGAGAAVAAGMVPIAHGGDGGGSIRIPASCCGIVGLKTSRGLTPFGPNKGESWGGMVSEHLLTVSVRDCAHALDMSAGPSAGAPYTGPVFKNTFVRVVNEVQSGAHVPKFRIGVVGAHEQEKWDAEVRAGYALFTQRLTALGHEVIEVAYPFTSRAVLQHVVPIIALNALTAIKAHAKAHTLTDFSTLQTTVQSMVTYAEKMSASDYIGHIAGIHALGRQFADFMTLHAKIDLLALPVLSEPPAQIGRFGLDWEDYEQYRFADNGLLNYSPYCPLANATGAPAISLPTAASNTGLPLGMQLLGAFGQDDLLIAAAAQYEAEFPWIRYAPILKD